MGTRFPDTQLASDTTQSALGTIQGSNYGGHAPLQLAHVFVLQIGTGGYGSKVTSLLTSSYASSTWPTNQDTIPGSPTNGMYYVTTSTQGQFSVSGDYTCTAGLPVYLYASGGNPSSPVVPATVTVTGASSSITTPGYMGDLVVTFSTTGTQLLYQGESVTFGTFSDPNYGSFSGTTQTVASVNLTTAQFSVVLGTSSTAPGSSTFSTTVTQAAAPNNPAVVNLALLGLCPSSGAQNFSYLNFVFMNEVSTVAAAYALAPFASTTANNDALHIGTSSTNLIGLQNAALTAANLYDIQGGNVGTGNDGDVHIARSVTPNGGYGTVPQTLLNTLGNILANCVDSANTYNAAYATTGTASAQCSGTASTGLFYNARSDGTLAVTGTTPNDTATAAINIAHYPGGAGTNTGFASNIYNSITGNVPFLPQLSSAPHDFAVGILYTAPGSNVSDVEVDGTGNIWTVGNGSNKVYELSPTAGFTTYSPPAGSTVSNAFQTGLAVDATSSNVYVPAGAGMLKFIPGTLTGTLVTASNNTNASMVAIDGAGNNLYVANTEANLLAGSVSNETASFLSKESVTGVAAGGNFPITGSTCTNQIQYVILDASNNVWTNNQFSNNNHICRYDSSGNLAYALDIPGSTFPLSYGGAVDAGGNFWFSEKDNSALYKIAAGTTGTYSGVCTTGCTQATGGTISTPFAAAVDGANNVWITNSGTSPASIVEFNNSAVAITPSYLSGTGYGNDYLYLQVDQAGNLWGASYIGTNIVEYVGVATPAAMPLSYARANGKLGAKP